MTQYQRDGLAVDVARAAANSSLQKVDFALITDLLHKTYWSRMWVLQEISLAKDVEVVCGTDRVTLDEFQRAIALVRWVRKYLGALVVDRMQDCDSLASQCEDLFFPQGLRGWKLPPAVWLSSEIRASGRYLGALHLLAVTCDGTELQASNSSDRLYSLIGLMGQSERAAIHVDYTKPCAELFADTTRLLLGRVGPDVFLYCGLAYNSGLVDDLPSWALDLTCTKRRSEKLLSVKRPQKRSEPYQSVNAGSWRILIMAAPVDRIAGIASNSGQSKDAAQAVAQLKQLAQQLEITDPSLHNKITATLCYRSGWPNRSSSQTNDSESSCTSGTAIDLGRYLHPVQSNDSYDIAAQIDRTVHNASNCPTSVDAPLFASVLWNDSPRNLFVTETGYVGSGPIMTKVGDRIYAFLGSGVPFALRPWIDGKEQGCWKLVGPVYVEGITSLGGNDDMQTFWDRNFFVQQIDLC